MLDKDVVDIFEKIRNTHIRIEKIFQLIAYKNSATICGECTDTCCKVDICRESVDSCFLSFIMDNKKGEFHEISGWLNNKMGCTLPYGRPFICYEYFCSKFENDTTITKIKHYTCLFKKIYCRTHKQQHILLIENLESIKKEKLNKILNDLINLEQELILTFK
jgi:hypothetical protein